MIRAHGGMNLKTTLGRLGQSIDWLGLAFTIALVGAATALSWSTRAYLSQPDVVIVYLLAIMVIAFRLGRSLSMVAAGLSVAAYDFFFVPPFFTFSVEQARYTLTFAMMFAVGFVISSLTARLRKQREEAQMREQHTAALYSLTRELDGIPDEDAAAEVVAHHSQLLFGGDASVLLEDEGGVLALRGASRPNVEITDEELTVASWARGNGRRAGHGTTVMPASRATCIPLTAGTAVLGILLLRPASTEMLRAEHRSFLEAFVRQAAGSFERVRLSEEARSAALRVRTEEMRSSLLSAVSHDLRTPLAAITGAGTALRDDSYRLNPEQQEELLDTICSEANRMERLLSNILHMVRVESGGIEPKRDWVPLEEIVGPALSRLDALLAGRNVMVTIPEDVPLLFVDPALLEQVFLNLIENAAKYAGPGSPIELEARVEGQDVVIAVADRGPGLPAGEEHRVFEKHYRGPQARGGGVGLGLAICLGIVQVHGGILSAENRACGGALFTIRLPLGGTPPDVSLDLYRGEEGVQ